MRNGLSYEYFGGMLNVMQEILTLEELEEVCRIPLTSSAGKKPIKDNILYILDDQIMIEFYVPCTFEEKKSKDLYSNAAKIVVNLDKNDIWDYGICGPRYDQNANFPPYDTCPTYDYDSFMGQSIEKIKFFLNESGAKAINENDDEWLRITRFYIMCNNEDVAKEMKERFWQFYLRQTKIRLTDSHHENG